jgi:hypothetical protein
MSDPYALGFEIVNAPEKPGQMQAIVVPDYVPVPHLKRLDFKWFRDLKNPLFESAKNTVEMRTRITWLSEGSLKHHLRKFETATPHGGCPDEKALYAKFLLARGHYPKTT